MKVLFFNISLAFGDQKDYQLVAKNFLKFKHCNKQIISLNELKGNKLVLSEPEIIIGYIAQLENGGYIIVSVSQDCTPIKAFSFDYNFETLPSGYRDFLLLELEYTVRTLQTALAITNTDAISDGICVDENPILGTGQRAEGNAHALESWRFLLQYDENMIRYSYQPDTFLITSKWNQDYPYNQFLPTINGQHVLTGCVPVAMAQLMRYYQYPPSGKGVILHTWNGENLKAILYKNYHWENMPDTLTANTDSYQKDEVARLLRDLGIANKTAFGLTFSGTAMLPEILMKHFGYSTGIKSMNNIDMNLFFSTIRSEIDAGRPMLLGIANYHIGIADGYSSNPTGKEIHINLGWGGHDDGYYFLDQTIVTSLYSFPNDLFIYYGIKPCSGDDCYTYLEPGDSLQDLTISGAFNSDTDADYYEIYLKGATTISGSRGFSNQAFFISLYDASNNLVASSENPLSLDLSYNKYTIIASLCEGLMCYEYAEDFLNYTIAINNSTPLTDEEITVINTNLDIPPIINANLKNITLNPAQVPYKILIDALDENADSLSLNVFTSTHYMNAGFEHNDILVLNPDPNFILKGAKITVQATANNKTVEKSFITLVMDEDIAFGKNFNFSGIFQDQNSFNTHKVILDGQCMITGYNGFLTQAFYSSVMNLNGDYVVSPDDVEINHNFPRGVYLIGASLRKNPYSPFGSFYYYQAGHGDSYIVTISCPDANDDIYSITQLLGVTLCLDNDHDGYSFCEGDCNDNHSAINPGITESYNGLDDNCNGMTDEGFYPTSLASGWNGLGVSFDQDPLTAEDLCALIIAQGISCKEIDCFINGGWEGHICGLPINNFSIQHGYGYVIKSLSAGTYVSHGTGISSPLIIDLKEGWNSVSLPDWIAGRFDAQNFINVINNQGGCCTEINCFLIGGWEAYITGLPATNFFIEPGKVYMIKCACASQLSLSI